MRSRHRLLLAIGLTLVCATLGACAAPTSPGASRQPPSASGIPALPTSPAPLPTASIPTPAIEPAIMTLTGRPLYELSETEFMFSTGSGVYDVTMDLSTRCVNLTGKLLGGYQFVSRIIMATSLPITVTGTATGRTMKADTVLLPTTKDRIT
jgi:hypothetical protein